MNEFNNPEELLEQKKRELSEELKKSRKGCRGCLITVLVILILFLGSCIYVSHLPAFNPLMTCVENQMELYSAIQRYRDLHNAYPKSLNDIKEEYLKDKNIIYCPLDKKHEGYEYFSPDKTDQDFILRCKRHKLSENQPIPPIITTKDGKFAYDMNDFQNMQK